MELEAVGFCDETNFKRRNRGQRIKSGFKHSFKNLPSKCSAFISFKAGQLWVFISFKAEQLKHSFLT